MNHTKKYIPLCLWIITLQLVSAFMGLITQANLTPWYASLQKSVFTPPGFVFGIVWGVLYLMLAITGWQLYQHKTSDTSTLRSSFLAQLLLNWAWTPIFFYAHCPGIALVVLIAIAAFTVRCLTLAWSRMRPVFWLMLPYCIWVCFAAYLNAVIYLGNG